MDFAYTADFVDLTQAQGSTHTFTMVCVCVCVCVVCSIKQNDDNSTYGAVGTRLTLLCAWMAEKRQQQWRSSEFATEGASRQRR